MMMIRLFPIHDTMLLRRFLAGVLFGVLALGITPGIAVSGTLGADIVRAAVSETVRAYAAAHGLDIEAAVPHARNMEFQSIDHPSVKACIAVPAISGRTCPIRLEVMNSSGEVVRNLHIMAHVRVFAQAVVASREIARDDSIGIDDMEVKRMEVGGIKGYFNDPQVLVGAKAKTAIRSGTVFRKTIMLTNPLIRRGDRVTLKAVAGSVEVTSQGIARSDGARGDSIRVYNEMTRSTVYCTVIDSRTVRVGKGG